jgi:ATP-binding cassette subfamily F protein uup
MLGLPMNILSLDGVAKTLIGTPLFKDVSLGIEEGERIGLVGRNGAGKSTFLRVLSGALEIDEGTLARKRGLAVSVLPQNPIATPGMSLRDFLLEGESPLAALVREYEDAVHGRIHVDARRMGILNHRMEEEGGFVLERRYASLCTEFGLPDVDTIMDGMSGGMVKKAAVARCLAVGADLVLLDEPTNHLDLDAIELLEKKLLSSTFAFLLVTHDRAFLDAVCQRILEVDRSAIFSYPGNYSTFLEMRRERWDSLEKADARRETILKIEMKWLMRGARARATKSERRKDLIKDMQNSGLERPVGMGAFSSASRRLGRKILELKGVAKDYDGRRVLQPFSYEFGKGDRIGVVGPNGSGKTTLLGIMAAVISPSEGTVVRGDNTVVSYYGQSADGLPKDKRMLEFIRSKSELVQLGGGLVLEPERLLERFLFDRDMHDQRLSTLSGGELRRLQLVSVLAEGPNLLILDEPTNDLDIDTIELLENYIEDFDGCVITVSHDRAFLDGVTATTIALDAGGQAKLYPGPYGEYREALRELAEADALKAKADEVARQAAAQVAGAAAGDGKFIGNDASAGGARAKPRKASWAEKKEYEGILDQIASLEDEKSRLEALFASGASPADMESASRRYAELAGLIDARTARWEELAAIIEG